MSGAFQSFRTLDSIIIHDTAIERWRYLLNFYFQVLRLVVEKKNDDYKGGFFLVYKQKNIRLCVVKM
jgi:hypothetical protein